ncbi:MAG: type I-C CRISPR-associated protein Cas7/Csd2 [Nitrolancea sp.]
MTANAHLDVNRRHDFVLLFDVQDGNPNGDPDAGNMPRVDPETMQGLVTDVALKRKVRDYVDVKCGDQGRFKIYVQSGEALVTKHQRAYDALGLKSSGVKQNRGDVDQARSWMCQNFYDIRMFGAVMTVRVNAGQVRGPLQLTFARSFDEIVPLDVSITRVAVTNAADAEVVIGDDDGEGRGGKQTEMGRKAIVPYGLYRAYGFFNPHLAQQTGVDAEDLALFWEALIGMWDVDRSAARGMMATRELHVFSHESPLGNAPAHRLFDTISVRRLDGVEAPRSFTDYYVSAPDPGELAEFPGVTLSRLV